MAYNTHLHLSDRAETAYEHYFCLMVSKLSVLMMCPFRFMFVRSNTNFLSWLFMKAIGNSTCLRHL